MQQDQKPETVVAQQMANEGELIFPQNHCNRKYTHQHESTVQCKDERTMVHFLP